MLAEKGTGASMSDKLFLPTCGHNGAVVRDMDGIIVLSCDRCASNLLHDDLVERAFFDEYANQEKLDEIDAKLHNLERSLVGRRLWA